MLLFWLPLPRSIHFLIILMDFLNKEVNSWSKIKAFILLVSTSCWEPVNLPLLVLVINTPQYQLRQGNKNVQSLIGDLDKEGVLIPTISPFNSHIRPVLKVTNSKWNLTTDYRDFSNAVPVVRAPLPDIVALMDAIKNNKNILLNPGHLWPLEFGVINLASIWYSVKCVGYSTTHCLHLWASIILLYPIAF